MISGYGGATPRYALTRRISCQFFYLMAINQKSNPTTAAAKPARPQKWDFEERLRGARDTTHFDIEKKTRFAARFFQIILTILAYIFYGNVTWHPTMDEVKGVILSTLIVTPFLTGFNVLLYAASFFGKKWTSRRVLAVETLIDLGVVCTFLSHGVMLAKKNYDLCNPESTWGYTQCGSLNLFVFWLFFLMVAWMLAFWFDCVAWYRGVFKKPEINNDVLMDVRRVTRSRF